VFSPLRGEKKILVGFWLGGSYLEIPRGGAEGAAVVMFEPPHDAVEMEGVGTDSPRDGTRLRRPFAVGSHLAREARFHVQVPANRAGVLLGVPGPRRDGVPFFHRDLNSVGRFIFFVFDCSVHVSFCTKRIQNTHSFLIYALKSFSRPTFFFSVLPFSRRTDEK
jgi:hypothetical protein